MNHSQPNASRNASTGSCRKNESSGIWLAWAIIASRLLIDELAHVDRRGDLVLGDAERLEIGRRLGRVGILRHLLHQPPEVVAVGRRLVDAPGPGELGGAHADAVHLDVIGMAVVAVLVVDREHVGVLLLEDRASRAAASSMSALAERARRVVGRLAGHAGVEVVEELDAVDAEDLGGRVQLGDAPVDELLAGRERVGRVLAELAAVADTSTTRWPSLLARAIVPPVAIASSSGWA